METQPPELTVQIGSANALPLPTEVHSRARPLGFLAAALLLALVFSGHLFALCRHALNSDLHSYVVLIPFVSAYLLYLQRGHLPRDYRSAPALAMIPLVIGCTALFLRFTVGSLSYNDGLSLVTVALVCFIWAAGYVSVGKNWMNAAVFPLAFLFFLAPLPDRVVDWLETASTRGSAEVADIFFNITGTPAARDGAIFQLPGITIQIAQECSGIRSSWILFITSLIAGYLFLRKPWNRILLAAAVIPLGLVRNAFRILVLGLLSIHVGPEMIHSPLHHKGGPIFFVLSLIPLGLFLWFLRRRDAVVTRAVSSR